MDIGPAGLHSKTPSRSPNSIFKNEDTVSYRVEALCVRRLFGSGDRPCGFTRGVLLPFP